MRKMHALFSSLRSRGVLETFILSFWLLKLKILSIVRISYFKLRNYDLSWDIIFYGDVWLQRSTKHSIKIGRRSNLGDRVNIRCYGKGQIIMGDNISIGENTIIHAGSKIALGNNIVTGANCYINDTNHKFDDNSKPTIDQGWKASPILIEDNVWIGANVTILDGVTIGKDSVIGAGSVVTKDVLPNTVVAGVPAKLLYRRK